MNPNELNCALARVLSMLGLDPALALQGFRAQHPFPVAMRLASLGYRSMPVNLHKFPMLPDRWQERATNDPAQILRWQRFKQPSGYSVLSGRETGVIVIDVDGKRGREDKAKLEALLGPLPATWRVSTGRVDGGEHIWLALPPGEDDLRNQQPLSIDGVRYKIDLRGWHGQSVLPSSLHKSGKRYQWLPDSSPDDLPLAECPPAWWAFLPKKEATSSASRSKPSARLRSRGEARQRNPTSLLIGDGDGYGGFQDPIYRNAIQYFQKAGVDAPAEYILETLTEMILAAPKGPGRDVSRYLSGPDLARQVERAREFVRKVKSENGE